MVWLPTWYDCRAVLKQGGVADAEVIGLVNAGIPTGTELTELYKKILSVPACLKGCDAELS